MNGKCYRWWFEAISDQIWLQFDDILTVSAFYSLQSIHYENHKVDKFVENISHINLQAISLKHIPLTRFRYIIYWIRVRE